MFYKIAGILVEIYGESRMIPQTVSYMADLENLCYKRQNTSNAFTEDFASEEDNSSDASVFYGFTPDEIRKQLNEKPCLVNEARGISDFDANGNSCYVCRRMSDYETDCDGADFKISYRIVPEIIRPQGDVVGTVRGFLCVKTTEGITLLNTLDYFREYTVRMDFNFEFTACQIELCDMESMGGLDLETRLHSYIGEAFSYLALNQKRFVFHSSTILYNECGICFSAPSGTGKSTHADLWEKYYDAKRLNDDTPAIFCENGQAFVAGTPWSGKSELNINKIVPLKAVVFLYQSPDNKIERLNGMNALKKVLSEAKIPEFPEQFNVGLDVVSGMLNTTPVYVLGCNISKEAVDLVKSTLSF